MKPAQKCETDVAFDGKCGIIDSNKCWKGRTTMEKLSRMQQRVYDYIAESIAEHGYAPSVREVGEALGLKSPSTVHFHIKHLQEMGLIEKSAGKGRAITLKKQLQAVPVAQQPVGHDDEYFALRVRGESMLGVGILPDDLVVVHRQNLAQNGQIVVALLGDEATVKTLKRKGSEVWLMPANPDYQPIDGRECTILGRVVAVVRQY